MQGTVLITGASSGLGAAMAREFASRGYALALTARRTDALQQLVEEIRAQREARGQDPVRIEIAYLDVTDWQSVAPVLENLHERLGGLDIVIANAGVATRTQAGTGTLAEDIRLLETNVHGAIATIDAAVALFRRQRRGQIVAMASVAAFRGLPGFGAYSASKAALATYMESVQAELYGTQIKTTTLFPGYIDTPLNNRIKHRPFLIDAEKGGRLLVDLIERQVAQSTVPVFPWNLIKRVLQWAPVSVIAKQNRPARSEP